MAVEIVLCNSLLKNLRSGHVQEMSMLCNLRKELDTLDKTVVNVGQVLLALESDKFQDSDRNRSLGKLGNLLHEADDLIDQIACAASQKKTVSCIQVTKEVRLLPSSPVHCQIVCAVTLARKVVEICKNLNDHIKRMTNYLTDPETRSSIDLGVIRVEKKQDTAQENAVVGRDDDKKEIIEKLLDSTPTVEDPVGVVCMYGLPGLGKSTLAQLVYYDERVENRFELRLWVCVSKMTNETRILQEILESITRRKPKPDVVIDVLERQLRREIDGKLYLLVLDDLRIQFPRQWKRLFSSLSKGARGSKILVTVRPKIKERVFMNENIYSYPLSGLSPEDSWVLIEGDVLSTNVDEGLAEIGKDIVQSCGGVPLTVRILGSLLYGETREKWLYYRNELIRSDNSENDITYRILQLSYGELPAHLKACVCYCALFPQDFEFNKCDLISLWMAQGFLNLRQDDQCTEENDNNLEDIAEKCFMELLRMCFLQVVQLDIVGNIISCKMHHLIHDFVLQTRAERTYMTGSAAKHASVGCRRDSSLEIPAFLLQMQRIRTFMWVKEPDCDAKLDASTCNMLISNFRFLRVLDLHDLSIAELPNSTLGELIHLRYLDLSKNESLLTLPRSITRLRNLQTLILNSCPKLKQLPEDIDKLVNLRQLEIDECDSITYMPLALEKLTTLQMLSRFIVRQPHRGLQILSSLKQLQGKLIIEFSGKWAVDIEKVAVENLNSNSKLTELRINWGLVTPNNVDPSSYEQLLDHLPPPSDLKILCIEGYRGADFPCWARADMLADSLKTLVEVSIEGCHKCQHLPPFGRLNSLKRLTLRHMESVQYVQNISYEQSLAASTPFFPALEELTLHGFYKLEGWWKQAAEVPIHQPSSFPILKKLEKLKIWSCPQLILMPLFIHAADIDLRNVNRRLLENSDNILALRALALPSTSSSSPPTTNTQFHYTKRLQIKGCPDLQSFSKVRSGLGGLSRLEYLGIEDCNKLESLSKELQHLASLEELEISRCKNLDISGTAAQGDENQNQNDMHWSSLSRLRYLTFKGIPMMEELPPGLRRVITLKFLWISSCNSITALPEWMRDLTSLQHLRIESCPGITTLPNGLSNLNSLVKVEITECNELMERCRENTGEDWPKISHARVLLHKSWRHGLMSDEHATQWRYTQPRRNQVNRYLLFVPVVPFGAI